MNLRSWSEELSFLFFPLHNIYDYKLVCNACKHPFDNLIFFSHMYLCLLQIYWLTWVWFCHWFYTFFTSHRLHIHNHYLSSNECIITQLTVWTTKFFQWRFLIKLFYERHKKGIPIRKWRTTAKTATSDNFNHSP